MTDIVLKKLNSFLIKNGFSRSKFNESYVKYELNNLTISLVYDNRENTYSLWIGDANHEVEIDKDILINFFGCKRSIKSSIATDFIDNVYQFLKSDGYGIIQGDIKALLSLEEYNIARSQAYTQKIIVKQNLEAANRAWQVNDYRKFVEYLDKIGKLNLAKSYQKKYDYARRIISN